MAFGISFGSKTQTTDSTTNMKKNEVSTGSQATSTQGAQSTSSSQTSTQNQNTAQQSTQTQNTAQQTTGQEQSSQKGTTTTLGADVQSAITDSLKSILAGGVNSQNIANIANMISGQTGFNADAMVRDIVSGARYQGEQQLQEQQSARESQIGGTAGTNSMAALLANRGRSDLEANIAAITGKAVADSQQIANQNLTTAVGAQGSLVEQGAQLGSVLKGATTTSDVQTLTNQLQQLLGQTGTTGSTTGQSNTQSSEQANSLQLISQLVNALTKQNTSTQGYENTVAKNKSSGGGISLGF